MYAPTATAHVATKLAAALIGSVFVLPATMSNSDSALHQVAQTSVTSIQKNTMEVATAGQVAGVGEKLEAPLARKPAGLQRTTNLAPGSSHRCVGNRCDPHTGGDKRGLLVMFALWRALAP